MTTVVQVTDHERPLGAYVVTDDRAVFRPAVDVNRLGLAALAVLGVTAVSAAAASALRRRPAVGTLSMGPGGWVSFRRTPAPPLRDGHRPWWARLLRAHELVVRR